MTPCTIAVCKPIGSVTSNKVLGILLESGSSKTLIHKQIVPSNYSPLDFNDDLCIFSLVGTTNSTNLVALSNIHFPEFNQNMVIDNHPALVISSETMHYDIIFGANFLDKCGFHLDYNANQVKWMEYDIPVHEAKTFFAHSFYTLLFTPLDMGHEDKFFGESPIKSYATNILDTKFEQANNHEVAFGQQHLSLDQPQDLFNILSKHKNLFDGSLGAYPHKQVHIELKPGAKPVHHCAYPVPHLHCQTFKKELDHMVELSILKPCGASEWASPAFNIPIKDGHI